MKIDVEPRALNNPDNEKDIRKCEEESGKVMKTEEYLLDPGDPF